VLRDWPEEGFCGNVLFQSHYSGAAEIFQGPRKPDFSALSALRKPRAFLGGFEVSAGSHYIDLRLPPRFRVLAAEAEDFGSAGTADRIDADTILG